MWGLEVDYCASQLYLKLDDLNACTRARARTHTQTHTHTHTLTPRAVETLTMCACVCVFASVSVCVWSLVCCCCCYVASVVSDSVRPHSLLGSSVPGILQARVLEWGTSYPFNAGTQPHRSLQAQAGMFVLFPGFTQ